MRASLYHWDPLPHHQQARAVLDVVAPELIHAHADMGNKEDGDGADNHREAAARLRAFPICTLPSMIYFGLYHAPTPCHGDPPSRAHTSVAPPASRAASAPFTHASTAVWIALVARSMAQRSSRKQPPCPVGWPSRRVSRWWPVNHKKLLTANPILLSRKEVQQRAEKQALFGSE